MGGTGDGAAPAVTVTNWLARVAMGLMFGFWATVLVILPAALAPPKPWSAALLPLAFVAAFGRALRIRLVLGTSTVRIYNYFETVAIEVADVEALVPGAARVLSPGGGACAGFQVAGRPAPYPAMATMSWSWTFGGPSRKSRKLFRLLSDWAAAHGIPMRLEARHLG
ncbi:MAG TPA: hypothetical protein VFJ85_19925 [Acidimicrobiales bacterium]|nr:hypothetical protein [Acidimicrobiales bacterium]